MTRHFNTAVMLLSRS